MDFKKQIIIIGIIYVSGVFSPQITRIAQILSADGYAITQIISKISQMRVVPTLEVVRMGFRQESKNL